MSIDSFDDDSNVGEQIKNFISSQLCNSWKQGHLSFTQICAKLSPISLFNVSRLLFSLNPL